jgi:hypothetical protein
VRSTIVKALDALDLKFPRADKASLKEFAKVRKALEAEGKRGGKRMARQKAAAQELAQDG